MGLKIKIAALLLGLICVVFVFRYIKRNSFRPAYGVLWLSIASFLISIPIFEFAYKWLAVNLIGIEDARHIIYISLIGFLLVFNFHLTIFVTRLSDRIQELISFIAVLENKICRETGMKLFRSEDENYIKSKKPLEDKKK